MNVGNFLGKGYLSFLDAHQTAWFLTKSSAGVATFATQKSDDAILNLYNQGIQFNDGTYLYTKQPDIYQSPGLPGINQALFVALRGDVSLSTQFTLTVHAPGVIYFGVSFEPEKFIGEVGGGAANPGQDYVYMHAASTQNPYIEPLYWQFSTITPGVMDWPASEGYVASCVGCNLRLVNLSAGAIPDFDMGGADLTDGTFALALLYKNNLSKANLTGVDFQTKFLQECHFDDTDLTVITGKTFGTSSIAQCTFVGSNLTGLDFSSVGSASMKNCTFDGAVMDGANVSGIDLSYGSFRGVDMRPLVLTPETVIAHATFPKAIFTDATNYNGVDFHNSSFATASVTGAQFDGAVLYGCVFDGLDLTGASFGAAPRLQPTPLAPPSETTPRTSFVGATMTASLIGPEWSFLDLSGATLNDLPSDLSGLQAQYCKMSDMPSGTFDGVTLRGSNFAHAVLNVGFGNVDLAPNGDDIDTGVPTSFEGAILRGSNLSGAVLTRANLTQIQGGATSTEKPMTLSQAYMPNAILTGAVLNGVDLSEAQIYGPEAMLDNVLLDDATLSGATLSGVTLSEAKIRGATFTGANLIGATLTGVDLSPSPATGASTSFVQANLIGVDFGGVAFGETSLADAVVALEQGVPLFQIDAPGTYMPDLDKNNLSAALREVFSVRNLDLHRSAVAVTLSQGASWLVIQYPEYDLSLNADTQVMSVSIAGVDVLSIKDAQALASGLDAGKIPDALRLALSQRGFYLNTSAEVEAYGSGSPWSISQIPSAAQAVGYHTLGLSVVGDTLGVFGTKLMVSRIGAGNAQELVIVDVTPTLLTASQFGPKTICPNRRSYGDQDPATSWMQMMTSPNPAKPPICVPSGSRWCTP